MKAILNIIVDVSSSMNEMGKIHLQRNLCRYTIQLQKIDKEKYEDFDIRIYEWAESVSEVAVQSDIPALTAVGSSSLSALSDFLSTNLNMTDRSMVLILSDGYFDNSKIFNFQEQLKILSDLIIRTVAVGADADLLNLKKISSNNSVHLSENISTAIDCVLFSCDDRLAGPTSTAEIQEHEPIQTEDEWDE